MIEIGQRAIELLDRMSELGPCGGRINGMQNALAPGGDRRDAGGTRGWKLSEAVYLLNGRGGRVMPHVGGHAFGACEEVRRHEVGAQATSYELLEPRTKRRSGITRCIGATMNDLHPSRIDLQRDPRDQRLAGIVELQARFGDVADLCALQLDAGAGADIAGASREIHAVDQRPATRIALRVVLVLVQAKRAASFTFGCIERCIGRIEGNAPRYQLLPG